MGNLKDSGCVIALPGGNTQAKTPTGLFQFLLLLLNSRYLQDFRREVRVFVSSPVNFRTHKKHGLTVYATKGLLALFGKT